MLEGLVEENGANLTSGEREQFLALLLEHADIFASSEQDLGHTN